MQDAEIHISSVQRQFNDLQQEGITKRHFLKVSPNIIEARTQTWGYLPLDSQILFSW